jgi:hypothetical protein
LSQEDREPWGLVLLNWNFHPLTQQRLYPGAPLHVYRESPGKTLCGLPVKESEYGWFSGGGDLDSHHFPFGPICSVCRVKKAKGGTA